VVWTGANRIFGCLRPDLLGEIVESLGRPCKTIQGICEQLGRMLTKSEEENVRQAEQQLLGLESAETSEYAALHGSSASE
jgi:hypothetical protein